MIENLNDKEQKKVERNKWLKPLLIYNINHYSPRFKPWAIIIPVQNKTVLTVYYHYKI
jgi:hypothetical protein